jgi:hypothetical protein
MDILPMACLAIVEGMPLPPPYPFLDGGPDLHNSTQLGSEQMQPTWNESCGTVGAHCAMSSSHISGQSGWSFGFHISPGLLAVC